MGLQMVTPPAAEPITLEQAKAHVRADTDNGTAEDAVITALIAAARQYVERATLRALITQTWRMTLDAWPEGGIIRLPRPPLASVTSVAYTDTSGASQNLAAGSDYLVDASGEPGRIMSAPGTTWPAAQERPAAITIEYQAGYGDAADDVPQALRQTILLILAHWYENREAVSTDVVPREMPLAAEALIMQHRVWWF